LFDIDDIIIIREDWGNDGSQKINSKTFCRKEYINMWQFRKKGDKRTTYNLVIKMEWQEQPLMKRFAVTFYYEDKEIL